LISLTLLVDYTMVLMLEVNDRHIYVSLKKGTIVRLVAPYVHDHTIFRFYSLLYHLGGKV